MAPSSGLVCQPLLQAVCGVVYTVEVISVAVVGPLTTAGLGSHTDWHCIFISLCTQKPEETAHQAPLVVVWLVSLVSGGGAALV